MHTYSCEIKELLNIQPGQPSKASLPETGLETTITSAATLASGSRSRDSKPQSVQRSWYFETVSLKSQASTSTRKISSMSNFFFLLFRLLNNNKEYAHERAKKSLGDTEHTQQIIISTCSLESQVASTKRQKHHLRYTISPICMLLKIIRFKETAFEVATPNFNPQRRCKI